MINNIFHFQVIFAKPTFLQSQTAVKELESHNSFHFDQLRLELGDAGGLLRPLVVVGPVALAEVDILKLGTRLFVILPTACRPPALGLSLRTRGLGELPDMMSAKISD